MDRSMTLSICQKTRSTTSSWSHVFTGTSTISASVFPSAMPRYDANSKSAGFSRWAMMKRSRQSAWSRMRVCSGSPAMKMSSKNDACDKDFASTMALGENDSILRCSQVFQVDRMRSPIWAMSTAWARKMTMMRKRTMCTASPNSVISFSSP